MAFDPRSRSDERAHSAIDILISWDNFIVTIQNGGGPGAADAETLFQSDCYICICGDEKRREEEEGKKKESEKRMKKKIEEGEKETHRERERKYWLVV